MKNLKNLGKALSKAEQKTIIGGLHHGTVGGGPGEICRCYTINYFCHNPPRYCEGTEHGSSPVSWSPILPKPACCN